MALFRTKGTISFISEITSGTTSRGNAWQRQQIRLQIPAGRNALTLLQLDVTFPNAIEDVKKFQVGDKVEVGFTVSAREWNGKWYNDVDLITIHPADQAAQPAQAAPATESPAPDPGSDPADDLPFN